MCISEFGGTETNILTLVKHQYPSYHQSTYSMKPKLHYLIISALLLVTVLFSCRKEDLEPPLHYISFSLNGTQELFTNVGFEKDSFCSTSIWSFIGTNSDTTEMFLISVVSDSLMAGTIYNEEQAGTNFWGRQTSMYSTNISIAITTHDQHHITATFYGTMTNSSHRYNMTNGRLNIPSS